MSTEVIAPTAIAQTAGVRAETGYAASHLIDGSGLSESPTADNLSSVTHADPTAAANPNTGWRTAADGLVPNVLVTPVSIILTQGDTLPTFGYAPEKLIDGSGLSATPTAENWASVAHPWVGGAAAWTTNATGSPHYFSNSSNPQPQFELDLGDSHRLTGLVVWGANRNEAARFEVSFSTDGGTTYGAAVTVTTGRFVGPASQHLVFPDGPHAADHVRLTITGTVSSLGYTSRAGGGDRVALSELRFTGVSSVAPQTRFVLDLVPNVLITPVFITQTQGDTRPDYGYAPEKLIDGSGLSATPTAENWASVAHPWVGGAAAWSTEAQGNPHYFSNTSNPQPQFELDLGGSHRLTGLVVWGAEDLENEAALFEVSFSTDGGATYGGSVTVTTGGHVGSASRLMRFPGVPHAADHVRLTITGNDKSVGYPADRGGGGVTLSELRLLGKAAADTHRLSGLVVWGFGGSLDEASDFSLEFSTDSGSTYGGVVETVQTSSLLGMGNELLAFATPRTANQVRLTVTENAQGRGWTGTGGEREGLGELRLVKKILASVTITSVAMHPTKDAFQVTITFSAPVTGFTIDDISVANGSTSGFTGTGTTYTVLVTPTSGVDDVTVAVAEDVAVGGNGNGNASASTTFEVDTKAPTFQAASVTGNMLVLTYDENLDEASTPAASAYTVTSDTSPAVTVTAVSVSGTMVVLTLSRVVAASETVTVSYTVPGTGSKLQDALGNPAARAVTNETVAVSALITAGDLLIRMDSMGVVTGLYEGDARGTDHNIAAQSTTLVSLVVESAATDLPSTGTGAHYKPTGWTYAAGTAGTGETTRGTYTFSFADNISVVVTAVEKAGYATLELTSVTNPDSKDIRLVIWGPLTTDITENIGDTVGMVSNRDFAVGMFGVNAKTTGGWPRDYDELGFRSSAVGGHSGRWRTRLCRNQFWVCNATPTSFGSILQTFTRDLTVERAFLPFATGGTGRRGDTALPVTPLTGDLAMHGQLVGSKVALFGVGRSGEASGNRSLRDVRDAEVLDRIGLVEVGEGMPHPIISNVWGKKAEKANGPYFIFTDLSTGNLDNALRLANDVGWTSIYRNTFWGVFGNGALNSVSSNFGGSDAGLTAAINRAKARRVSLGTHTLFSFIPGSLGRNIPRIWPSPITGSWTAPSRRRRTG